ncbi:MAG: hypothetical protein CMO38_02810 [Verrucomicrobiaceae bacterium]|nr:hypothetical protein [Verrucomicrobiaceae bacterium]|tara:strand:- start:49 stop:1830 length:1782 start_codon:yes stop_codon:yes gene_type:complete
MRLIVLLLLFFLYGRNLTFGANENHSDFEGSSKFWSFVGPHKGTPPEINNTKWPNGDIDRYILSKIESNGLSPANEAAPQVLVKRLFYDLIGLPPTFDEMKRFSKINDEIEYEKLIDHLLGRPEFGEKIASLWMNIARYAEDQAHQVGNNEKFFYPHAHKYRHWVIKSFNNDLPYNDFIRLQLAADQIDEVSVQDVAALGFLGLGPQYYDRGRLEVKAEEWEDSVDVVSRGFMALTVACARCHDHKYDPISAADYHAFAGIFASTEIHKREVVSEAGTKTFVHVVKDGKVQDLPLFKRGDVRDKGDVVPRSFLSILSTKDKKKFTKGSGRLELAEAIADPKNPLTARVAVNRIWQMLFGRGLVLTASNFGNLGTPPTHPELLDHLAIAFIEGEWSTKNLIKKILSSSTYKQSSIVSLDKRKMDEENKFYSYFPRRRLSAEMLRDAMLFVSEEMEKGDSGSKSLEISDAKNFRRTIYGRISRKELDHYLALFDYPDPNIHSSTRAETITPAQKLYFINSPFILARVRKIVSNIGNDNPAMSVQNMYSKILSRLPSEEELSNAIEYISVDKEKRLDRLQRFTQNLLISNEFIFRD